MAMNPGSGCAHQHNDREIIVATGTARIVRPLIEAYKARLYPMSPPDPIKAILFRMERQGLKPKDLEPMIGQRNRVYEVLNRKRKLTTAMVWRLYIDLGIPAESLIRQSG